MLQRDLDAFLERDVVPAKEQAEDAEAQPVVAELGLPAFEQDQEAPARHPADGEDAEDTSPEE